MKPQEPLSEPSKRLIENLVRQTPFAHPISHIKVIETHISWVILTGTFAYKFKKPVRFDFLDFSTLERRKYFCERELELNRQLAPNLYLDVVSVTGSVEQPRISQNSSDESVIEYAVRMREFSQDDIFLNRLKSNRLTELQIDSLANAVANFHTHLAQPVDLNSSYASFEQIQSDARQNFASITSQNPCELSDSDQDVLQQLRVWTEERLTELQQPIESRRRDGWVRLCHGDMHLGNLAWHQDQVEIFDRIEFNDAFQWIDVLSEIAFPVMDLIGHGRGELAWRLLNRYLEQTHDYDQLDLLRFYLVYRAMVRAKVAALQAAQIPPPEHAKIIASEHNYVQLAWQLSCAPSPFLYITHGLSGSGKSVAALKIAEARGAIRLRSDSERLHVFGHLPTSQRYSESTTQELYARLARASRKLLQQGWPVIVDAAFLKHSQRDLFRQAAESERVPFGIVHCDAPTSILQQRIATRTADPSEATQEVLAQQLRTQQPLDDFERQFLVEPNTQ
jgi:uncharacterized protein